MSRLTLPWYKHFPSEHIASTADLTLEEEGALFRLRDWTWCNGALPHDPAVVSKLIRAPRKGPLVELLLARYFESTPAGYIDANLESQRHHAEAKREKLISAGAKGGSARKPDPSKANAVANAQANAEQKPSYARSNLSIGGISTDLRDSTEEETKRLRPAGSVA